MGNLGRRQRRKKKKMKKIGPDRSRGSCDFLATDQNAPQINPSLSKLAWLNLSHLISSVLLPLSLYFDFDFGFGLWVFS